MNKKGMTVHQYWAMYIYMYIIQNNTYIFLKLNLFQTKIGLSLEGFRGSPKGIFIGKSQGINY